MNKYKVVAEFEVEGVMQVVDAEVELPEEIAAPFVAEGKIAPVEAPAA